jgi:hypothetical protein
VGSLLVDPVEPVQAAVAGIGGAHTESFMATSIAVGPGRYGILAVGRDEPLTADDLDTLAEVALEMAPGLAVAEQIERLRATARPPEPEPPAKRELAPLNPGGIAALPCSVHRHRSSLGALPAPDG